jgi:hypothetical protein
VFARHAVIAGCACILISCARLSHKDSANWTLKQVEWMLSVLAGDAATDCGHAAVEADNQAVQECVARQLAEGRAFHASASVMAIDSLVFQGIAQDVRGSTFRVMGDSDVHGGGGLFAKPLVRAFRCARLGEARADTALRECVGREEMR